MYDIFVSYARENESFAKALAKDFENEGFTVWWDVSIPAGKTFDDVIETAIKASKCVVVLWSSHSVKSEWVRLEAGEGRAKNALVPALIEEVQIPFAFKNIQAANLINWDHDHRHPSFIQLVHDIKLVLKENAKNAGEKTPVFEKKEQEITESKKVSNGIDKTFKKKYWPFVVAVVAILCLSLIWKFVAKDEVEENTAIETRVWEKIRSGNDTLNFQNYLSQYPNGKYNRQARIKLDSLISALKPSTENNSGDIEKILQKISNSISYETGKGEIKRSSYAALDILVQFMKKHSGSNLKIESHTDSQGAESNNQLLSQKRANSVKNYLINNGIESRRICDIGRGEARPIGDNATAAGRALNRRTELTLFESTLDCNRIKSQD